MRYTLKQCYKDMFALWSELAETGSRNKASTKFITNSRNRIADCPCCEYCSTLTNLDYYCSKCPAKKLWMSNGYYPCSEPSPPYHKWANTKTIKTRKKYARIIANWAKEKMG